MDKALFASGNTEWETPQDFFDILNRVFKFNLDVCATAKNAKCENYFNKQQDGLAQEWRGNIWCNPPYGRDIERWVKKAYECRLRGANGYGATIVMLLSARTDTKWMHKYVFGTARMIFLKGRLKFGNSGNSAPFPSMLAIYGGIEEQTKDLAKYLEGFAVLEGFNGGNNKNEQTV